MQKVGSFFSDPSRDPAEVVAVFEGEKREQWRFEIARAFNGSHGYPLMVARETEAVLVETQGEVFWHPHEQADYLRSRGLRPASRTELVCFGEQILMHRLSLGAVAAAHAMIRIGGGDDSVKHFRDGAEHWHTQVLLPCPDRVPDCPPDGIVLTHHEARYIIGRIPGMRWLAVAL